MSNGSANGFIDRLTPADFSLLKPLLIEEDLEWKLCVAESGQDLESVWFPQGAVLSVIKTMRDGRSAEACTIGREGVHGLLHALGNPISLNRVVVQIGGRCSRASPAEIRRLAHGSPTFLDSVIRYAQANAAQAEQSVACNALHTVEQRLCRWLLTTDDRTEGEWMELTQEFMGLMLGVQRTTVTVAARALQDHDWIDYRRGRIRIQDREALMRASCECYQTNRVDTLKVLARN